MAALLYLFLSVEIPSSSGSDGAAGAQGSVGRLSGGVRELRCHPGTSPAQHRVRAKAWREGTDAQMSLLPPAPPLLVAVGSEAAKRYARGQTAN